MLNYVKTKNLNNYGLTDMNDVTILVNHNVAIVPIFDLQQESKDTVGRHRGYEITPCSFKTLTTFITKFLRKYIIFQKLCIQSTSGWNQV